MIVFRSVNIEVYFEDCFFWLEIDFIIVVSDVVFIWGGVYLKQEGKKILERELVWVKIIVNRVVVVVVNEWKDVNDKVMFVKQWFDERWFMQVSLVCILQVFFNEN